MLSICVELGESLPRPSLPVASRNATTIGVVPLRPHLVVGLLRDVIHEILTEQVLQIATGVRGLKTIHVAKRRKLIFNCGCPLNHIGYGVSYHVPYCFARFPASWLDLR